MIAEIERTTTPCAFRIPVNNLRMAQDFSRQIFQGKNKMMTIHPLLPIVP